MKTVQSTVLLGIALVAAAASYYFFRSQSEQPAFAHESPLADIASRLSQTCPQAALRYDNGSMTHEPNLQNRKYLDCYYRVGTFQTYTAHMIGPPDKKILHGETGPDDQGFLLTAHLEDDPKNKGQFESQTLYPHTFSHQYAGGRWIEYVNWYRLPQEPGKILWISLAFGPHTSRTLLKQIRQAATADAQPIKTDWDL